MPVGRFALMLPIETIIRIELLSVGISLRHCLRDTPYDKRLYHFAVLIEATGFKPAYDAHRLLHRFPLFNVCLIF